MEKIEFGEWEGSLDTSRAFSPLEISVDNFDDLGLESLYLACTPRGWESEGEDPWVFTAFYTLSPEIAEFEGNECQLEASGYIVGEGDVSLIEQGVCQDSGLSILEKVPEFLEFLSKAIDIRFTLTSNGKVIRTFEMPSRFDGRKAMNWLWSSCEKLRRVPGGILIPGPTFGGWRTQYKYDTFHEGVLKGSINASAYAKNGDYVSLKCGNFISVRNSSGKCRNAKESRSTPDWDINDCPMLAKSSDEPAIRQKSYCANDCWNNAVEYKREFFGALLKQDVAKIRLEWLVGASEHPVRDIELSTLGLVDTLDWIESKCDSDDVYRPLLPGLSEPLENTE